MALGYFLGVPDSDRGLFVLWLLGFAAIFICRAIPIDARTAQMAGAAAVLLTAYWFAKRTPGQEYAIANFPVFALAFMSLAIATQRSAFLTSRDGIRRVIRLAADYSFSLFLVHLTLVKVILAICPWTPSVNAAIAVVCANVGAVGFAFAFERHYRTVAKFVKVRVLSVTDVAVK
jgi:peptidoglycan/LPS O-acetylase OafA/YrhL